MINKTTFNTLYNNPTGGHFPTNTSQQIGSDDCRSLSFDIKESTFFLMDNAYDGAKGITPTATTIATLKSIVTTNVGIGAVVVFMDTASSNVLRVYTLKSGTDAESSPDVIRPNDYTSSTNEKVWKLAHNSVDGGTVA